MRGSVPFAVVIAVLACTAAPARADHAPVIVVPSRLDVPVVIGGQEASFAVVEGGWGLYRPGHVAPAVIGPALVPLSRRPGGYYPATGRRPAYGRREVIPSANRPLPPPAAGYSRAWSSQPVPPLIEAPSPVPLIVAPYRPPRFRR